MEPPNTAMPPGAEIHYAGFRRRVWASLIDDLFLIVPTLAILTLTGFDMMSDEIGHGPDATDHGADGIGDFGHGAELSTTTITAAFWWLYYALMESSRRQASLGKLVMRLKVTDMAGRRVSFAAATLRAWPFYLFGVFGQAGHEARAGGSPSPPPRSSTDMVSGDRRRLRRRRFRGAKARHS